ncbi:MAG: YgjV family protein [Mogibacterium sp.]|nr:YgjV family protein [Mogibacterium sp.]
MNGALALELFGYLGSVVILVSMLMTSVVRLRVINMIGSVIFTTYAILIHSFPTAFLNGCLVLVNIYQLWRLRHTTRNYEVLRLDAGEGFAAWFVNLYRDDIRRYFPTFEPEQAVGAEGFAVFYENQAAGLLLGKRRGGDFDILIDYATPAYRDCSVGTHLYSQLPACNVARLVCKTGGPEHIPYMQKMGFTRIGDAYVKVIVNIFGGGDAATAGRNGRDNAQ